jgi:hypothetical protein
MSRCISGYSDVLPLNIVSSAFFTGHGSLIDECAGFAIHRTEEGGFGYKMPSSAGIFTEDAYCLILLGL